MAFDSFFAREGKAKKLYPVVHVRDVEQALQNTTTAFLNGADGVFLINHSINTGMLLMIAAVVRGAWPKKFIGINVLGESAGNAWDIVSLPHREFNAVWVDDPKIGDRVDGYAHRLNERMSATDRSCYYFASVAFKYQPVVTAIAQAAHHGSKLAHVVVTSGDGTGAPPTVEKIRTMKEAIPNHPLAIASGMTCDNIHRFLPYADIFMVATGISDNDDSLDARLVDRMAMIIQNYNKSSGLLA